MKLNQKYDQLEACNSNDFLFFFLCSQVARLGGKSGGLITHSPFRVTCADVLIRALMPSPASVLLELVTHNVIITKIYSHTFSIKVS